MFATTSVLVRDVVVIMNVGPACGESELAVRGPAICDPVMGSSGGENVFRSGEIATRVGTDVRGCSSPVGVVTCCRFGVAGAAIGGAIYLFRSSLLSVRSERRLC